jgi:hypothetical protein
MSDYHVIDCDVQWPDGDHSLCRKCDGYGRVPIVSEQVRDQFLQWAVGALLVIVLALTVAAVWGRR